MPTMEFFDGQNSVGVTRTNPLPTRSATGGLTDGSGTISVASTAQDVFAENADRKYLRIINMPGATDRIWVNIGATATAGAGSIPLAAGESLVFDGSFVPTGRVSVLSPTVGIGFTAKEG